MTRSYGEVRDKVTNQLSAAAVVLRAGTVLLIKRADTGEWQIPGGAVRPGEDPRVACVREVREETGLLCSPVGISGVYWHAEIKVTALVFLAVILDPDHWETIVSDESPEVLWLSVSEALERLKPPFQVRVQDALTSAERAGAVPFRIHNGEYLLDS